MKQPKESYEPPHDQFRPGPPPALTSALYAADVNEVKAMGRFDSAVRTATTALAASEEGFRCIGIDQSEDYLRIAEGRLQATPIGLGLSA